MKKSLLSFSIALLIGASAVQAQTPDAIYIGTWDGMMANYGNNGVGTPVTPNTADPKLSYNADTQCYEGVIYDWAISAGTTAWNAKIPYSFEGDVVTYYSGTSYPNINFNESDTYSAPFIVSEDPANLKGYNLSTSNSKHVYAAKVSINLSNNTITFTEVENESEAPVFVGVNPENGSIVVPDADGNVEIALTFSGAVSSIRFVVEGSTMRAVQSADGAVWTFAIPADDVQESVNENSGLLVVKIDQVYAGNIPVALANDKLMMELAYPVEGVSDEVTFQFEGLVDAAELMVYKTPFFTLGHELSFSGDALNAFYALGDTYLFTVAPAYSITITSTAPADSYTLGTAWSIENYIDADKEIFEERNYREGPTVSLQSAANGSTFTVEIKAVDAAVDSIGADLDSPKVYYNLQGLKVENPLKGGIYILNGKKIVY